MAMTETGWRDAGNGFALFQHAPAAEYCAIFTPNASGALKLVGESRIRLRRVVILRFRPMIWSIRSTASANLPAPKVHVTYLPLRAPDLWLRSGGG